MRLVVDNFRALRHADIALPKFGLLTGGNGSGKSTFLALLRFLRLAYERGPEQAWNVVFRGSQNVRSLDAKSGSDTALTLMTERPDGSGWTFILQGSTDGIRIEDHPCADGEMLVGADGTRVTYRGQQPVKVDVRRTSLRSVVDSEYADDLARGLAAAVQNIWVYAEPNLVRLREVGSRMGDGPELAATAENLFAVLLRWHTRRPDRARYDFVLEGLRAAFPRICSDLDFETLQDTVRVRVYHPGVAEPTWASEEASGFLQMMVLLTEVASANDGGIVAIDEPETSLHPFALRELARRARAWGEAHRLTILLATHSPVLLNDFNADPASVIVFGEDPAGPRPLTELKNPEWLAGYLLGEAFESLAIGSNDAPTPA